MYKNFISASVIFLFSLIVSGQVYGQSKTKIQIKEKNTGSYPIAGSDLLRDQYIKTAQFLQANPDYFSQAKLKKTTAWNFTVGTKKFWTAINFTTNAEYSVASTCRAIGTHCYIFVADDVWDTSVDSSAVLGVINDFDNQTPANPNKGIYQTDVDTFGEPPDVDSDPRIIILILDIQDGYNGSGGFIAGYFSPNNETRGGGQAAEIYFMDANPVNLKTASGLNEAVTTAAHEFQHMINWRYHMTTPELTFVNEGLSMVAEVVCGYGVSMQTLYANEPNHYLFDWRSNDMNLVLNDYARAQRFFLYIMEQFGTGSLKQIVQDNTTFGLVGISGLSKILSYYYSTSLGKVFLNWEIANGLNNTSVNPAYGYTQSGVPVTTGTKFFNPNISSTSSTLQNFGAEFFTYTNSANLNVTYSSAGSNIIVKALEIGAGSSRVLDVPLNSGFNEPDYPNVYNTIRFAAIDTNLSSAQPYQYQSSGTTVTSVTEIKWDNTEPSGYYVWTPSDTVCVTFDALPGGKLDSIKVALRRAGTITGGVWRFTGSQNPTPLGQKLAVPITASISTTVGVPYPVPYNNWSSVDLRSYNISTDQPFAVGFAIGSDPKTPGVMVTDYQSSGSYHSYTYLQTADNVSTSGWYYITSNNAGDTVAIYLIRAYVSLVTGVTKQNIELAPDKYSLSQNYPNPFNPATNIKFQIAKDGFVSLKIYDILGNEVKTLVNEYMNKGTYNTEFSGAGLASGIYFYKLQTNGYTAVKKLMLLK
jgi:hypothetical protein